MYLELMAVGTLCKELNVPADFIWGLPADLVDRLMEIQLGWNAMVREEVKRCQQR